MPAVLPCSTGRYKPNAAAVALLPALAAVRLWDPTYGLAAFCVIERFVPVTRFVIVAVSCVRDHASTKVEPDPLTKAKSSFHVLLASIRGG